MEKCARKVLLKQIVFFTRAQKSNYKLFDKYGKEIQETDYSHYDSINFFKSKTSNTPISLSAIYYFKNINDKTIKLLNAIKPVKIVELIEENFCFFESFLNEHLKYNEKDVFKLFDDLGHIFGNHIYDIDGDKIREEYILDESFKKIML